MQSIVHNTILGLILLLLLAGCSRDKDQKVTPSESGDQAETIRALAVVGNRSLNADEVKAYVKSRSDSGTSVLSLDRALEELTVSELLYQEAIRRKIDLQPEVRQILRQLYGQRLLTEQVNIPAQTRMISEEELKAYYEEHRELYVRPERIRLADIFIAFPVGSDEKIMNDLKKKAEDILVKVQLAGNERFSFSKLVRDNSDQHPKYQLGDTGFFDKNGGPVGLTAELVEAAFAIADTGMVADHVTQTADGFHIIKLVARRPPFSRDFVSVAKEIEQKIRKEEISTNRASFISSLRQAKVEIRQDVLERTRQELLDNRNQTGSKSVVANRDKPILPGQ